MTRRVSLRLHVPSDTAHVPGQLQRDRSLTTTRLPRHVLPIYPHLHGERRSCLSVKTEQRAVVRSYATHRPAPCVALDLAPPETKITEGPSGMVASRDAALGFASSETASTFKCRLDGRAWENCSTPKRYFALLDGNHRFEVRASDAAGNADPTPAAHGWGIDTAGPRIKIAKRRLRLSRRGLVRLRIRCPGSEASGPCSGKVKLKTTRRLRRGNRVTLGGRRFSISVGASTRISVKLSKRNRRLAARLGRLRTRATARASDRLGNTATTSRTLTLVAPDD